MSRPSKSCRGGGKCPSEDGKGAPEDQEEKRGGAEKAKVGQMGGWVAGGEGGGFYVLSTRERGKCEEGK